MRKWSEISRIVIEMRSPGAIIEVAYKDRKSATFSIDRGGWDDKKILQHVFPCIQEQLDYTTGVVKVSVKDGE